MQALVVDLNIAHADSAVLPVIFCSQQSSLGEQILQSAWYEPSIVSVGICTIWLSVPAAIFLTMTHDRVCWRCQLSGQSVCIAWAHIGCAEIYIDGMAAHACTACDDPTTCGMNGDIKRHHQSGALHAEQRKNTAALTLIEASKHGEGFPASSGPTAEQGV